MPDPPKDSHERDDEMLYDDIISDSDKSQSPHVKMSFDSSGNSGNNNDRKPSVVQLKRKAGSLTESGSKEEYVMDMEQLQDNVKVKVVGCTIAAWIHNFYFVSIMICISIQFSRVELLNDYSH